VQPLVRTVTRQITAPTSSRPNIVAARTVSPQPAPSPASNRHDGWRAAKR
jgi:hypothetical protein